MVKHKLISQWWCLVFILLSISVSRAESDKPSLVAWQSWSPAAFTQASTSKRYVLLNMEAVWCHWCHVMDQKTYANPEVAAYIKQHYIAVKVDHDARPDLAERYRDYGWPATIVLAADGTEIVKRAGYIAPENFLQLLKAIVADPSPENVARTAPQTTTKVSARLSDKVRRELQARHVKTHDHQIGGLTIAQKFIERPHVEYALHQAQVARDPTVARKAARRATQTLSNALGLLDPEWGGVYQYSTHGDWKHPHYEKIMSSQTGYLRLYARAAAQQKNTLYRYAAQSIYGYLVRFMRDDNGGFYTSQDADLVQGKHSGDYFKLNDQARLAQGMPRIDKNQYVRENGWVIESILSLYEIDPQQEYVDVAQAALTWVEAHRRLPNGGFKHGEKDAAGPYLGDALAMLNAYLQAYKVGLGTEYLQKAVDTAAFIQATFKHPKAGVFTAKADGSPVLPVRDITQNIRAARSFNLLSHYSGKATFKRSAQHIMRYLAQPHIALSRIEESGILLLDYELANPPAHYTVVGGKEDAQAAALFRTALAQGQWYERVEWYDPKGKRLMNHDVTFPTLPYAAGFVCANQLCSLPSIEPDLYQNIINRLNKRTGGG